MPKSEQETTAIKLAIKYWSRYAKCSCTPKIIPEGKGYDLGCGHKHVEVKGTGKEFPGFRGLTKGEFDAARKDSKFELWLISNISNGKGTFHIVKSDEVLRTAKPTIHWHLPLGKTRMKAYREAAKKREKTSRNMPIFFHS